MNGYEAYLVLMEAAGFVEDPDVTSLIEAVENGELLDEDINWTAVASRAKTPAAREYAAGKIKAANKAAADTEARYQRRYGSTGVIATGNNTGNTMTYKLPVKANYGGDKDSWTRAFHGVASENYRRRLNNKPRNGLETFGAGADALSAAQRKMKKNPYAVGNY